MPATSWTERNKDADGWTQDRWVGPAPTEFVLINGAVLPVEGSSEPVQAVSWSERSVSPTSFTEKSQSSTSWTENT